MNEDFSYIAAIAQYGSISKAARMMHISQPGLSQRLKRVEAQFGTELFDRATTPLKPTPSGEVYLRYALRGIAAEENLRRDVYSVANMRRQRLTIGVSTPRANTVLADAIVSFYETHQGCTLEFREMHTLEQLHALFLGDDIDFAVLTPISPDPSQYDVEVLRRERLVLAVSRLLEAPQLDRAIATARVDLADLEGLPFVLPTCGGYLDPLVARFIEVSNVRLDVAVRDCSTELGLALVEAGLGAAIVPSTSLLGRENLRAFDLVGIEAGNDLHYIRRRDRDASDEERLFMDILKAWIADHPRVG